MATCLECGTEMTDKEANKTCKPRLYVYTGSDRIFRPIPYGSLEEAKAFGIAVDDTTPFNDNCHDCNVQPGGIHHLGCDLERCPKCKGQLISCSCKLLEQYEQVWKTNDAT